MNYDIMRHLEKQLRTRKNQKAEGLIRKTAEYAKELRPFLDEKYQKQIDKFIGK